MGRYIQSKVDENRTLNKINEYKLETLIDSAVDKIAHEHPTMTKLNYFSGFN